VFGAQRLKQQEVRLFGGGRFVFDASGDDEELYFSILLLRFCRQVGLPGGSKLLNNLF